MHFRSPKPSIDLVFGSCWHYGLEVGYKLIAEGLNPSSMALTKLSSEAFNNLWQLEGEPHFDADEVFPKSPVHAANMYQKYWEEVRLHDGAKIIGVEAPFTINLSTIEPGLPNYIGRQDLVLQSQDGYIDIVDHKSTKAISAITQPGFEISLQTDGYLTAGHMYYDTIPRMIYSIALCQKTKIAFHQFTIMKAKYAIERFLTELVAITKDIHNHLTVMHHELSVLTEKQAVPKSFPRKPGYACTAYFRPCAFMQICNIRNNPLLWYNDPPQGYVINEWDPDEHEASMKAKLGTPKDEKPIGELTL